MADARGSTCRVPAISIVLPVRNAAATLPRALGSVRSQCWPDWELIAVDDGSADATPDLLRAAAGEDARVRLLSPGRVGLVAALNLGLQAARGEFIARMDADDEMHPDRLAAQAERLRREPALGLVGCLVAFGGDREAQAGYAAHVDWMNALVSPEAIALNRFVESPLAHPSVMFRRELVARHGGYRAGDYPEDYELWLRWLDAGVRMAKVPEVLLMWHDDAARLSRTDPRYGPEAFFRLKAEWIARWLRREIDPARKIFVWGAGRPTRLRAAHLQTHGVTIAGYVDIDPRKIGQTVHGLPVIAPAALPERERAFVLSYVANRGARDWIRAELQRQGRAEGRDFLLCA